MESSVKSSNYESSGFVVCILEVRQLPRIRPETKSKLNSQKKEKQNESKSVCFCKIRATYVS